MIADPHPDVTVILKRTDGIIHRTPHELVDKDIKMKKEKKMLEKLKEKGFLICCKDRYRADQSSLCSRLYSAAVLEMGTKIFRLQHLPKIFRLQHLPITTLIILTVTSAK